MRMPASRACAGELRLLREADAVGRGLDAEVADLARVADGVEEDRRDRRLAARELHRHLPARLDADRVVEQLLDFVQRQLVDVADLIGVHEARVAHHVAAVGQVDREHRAAAVLDRRRAVVVQPVGHGVEITAREQRFDALEERRVDRQRVGERAVNRAGLLDDDLAVALDDGGRDLADVLVDERLDRLFAGEDPRARLAHAGRAERIGRARPAERRDWFVRGSS